MKHKLPRAVLLDLDDTILNDSGNVEDCWRQACYAFAAECRDVDPAVLLRTIDKTREWFWSDPDRHREGRLDLEAARREIVNISLVEVGVNAPTLAARIAERYSYQREERIEPFPEAIDTVRWLRESGCRLALLTNGNAASQRKQIIRFGLEELFDAILIEGELGFGKPDSRVYMLALRELMTAAVDAWMVGDNLEWDVVQPRRMGLSTIWIDVQGKGLPETNCVRPNRIVRQLSELRECFE